MSLLKLVRLPMFSLITLIIMGAIATPTVSAQSCPAADADDGSSDGVITINSGGTTTWTDTDGTAFDCATLSITVTNSSTLAIAQDQSAGYSGQINAVNLQVDSGSTIEANAQGCASSTSPSLSTNICAGGGTYEGGDESRSGGGGAGAGAGGKSSVGTAGGVYIPGDVLAPTVFGAGGGAATTWPAAGGAGGGALRFNLSGNLTNNGTISANGGAGVTTGYPGAGGGGGGSLYITVGGNIVTATGTYQAKGGAGGDGDNDGGGAGGGFIYVEYATSSISSSSFSTYTDISGGTATGTAVAGGDGSAVFKDTTSSTVYFIEGDSKVVLTSNICSSNTCSFTNIVVESGGEGQFVGDTGTGDIMTVNVSGAVNVKSGGKLSADELGCIASYSANLSTNVCANGGTYEGADGTTTAGAGAGASGAGGNGSNGAAAGAFALTDILAPTMFGSGGGSATNYAIIGGKGGGTVRLNITGNLTNNGVISANAENGTNGGGRATGGGSGGSVYITVGGNLETATGLYEAKGGNGGDGSTYDGGGGGGGFVYLEYATSSIATSSFVTYTDMSGGTAAGSGGAGSDGSAIFKDTTSTTIIFVEGFSRVTNNTSGCSSYTCSFTNLNAESGGEGRFIGDTSTGSYFTVNVSGAVNVKSGGRLSSDESGCVGSQSVSLSTNICADGGSYEGVDGSSTAGGGAGASGEGGASSNVAGTTFALADVLAPAAFGSGGGDAPIYSQVGGKGGGVLRLNVTGNLTNNGSISVNAANGTNGTGRASGGGAGGSLHVTVGGNIETATGLYEAKGGNGGDGSTYDGGGGGGGFVYVTYATSSIAIGSFATYTDMSGGTVTGSATAGGVGSSLFKDTTSTTIVFVEGISRINNDTTGCTGNTCSFTNMNAESDGEGRFLGDDSAGTFMTVNVSEDVNVKSGGIIGANEGGCTSSTSPSLSTNICADGGTTEGGDDNESGNGASASGAGGKGNSSNNPGALIQEDIFAPNIFGSGGGKGVLTTKLGGTGGGVLRLNVTGNLTNNGAISVNAGDGAEGGTYAGGGGAGGSLYVTVSGNIETATGLYESKGGDGGDSSNDGGGGGGGFVYIEYATSSIATGSFATYADMSGGTATGSGVAGGAGSAIFKDTANTTSYFIEGISRLRLDSSVCSSDICSISNIVSESGGELRAVGNITSGAYMTIEVSGDVNVKSGGKISADESGCSSTTSANVTTNACADGGTSEGGDDNEAGGGGAHAAAGGNANAGGLGGTTIYGDSTAPTFFGSGGGRGLLAGGSNGGIGGGVLVMNITGTLTQNGTISADGQIGQDTGTYVGGGGAGGSVYLAAGTLAGSSTAVYARGGNGADGGNDGGGGGGGRVCVAYTTNSSTWLASLTAATNAAGGTGPGTALDGGDGSLNTGTCTFFNEAPTAATVTFSQATDGTGYVTGTVIIDDADDDTDVQFKVEYSVDGGGSYSDPTLIAPTSASTGTPVLNNATTYQVSSITTASGANTVTFTWDSKTDGSFDVSNARFKITPYDTTAEGSAVESSDSVIDNIAPVTSTLSYTASTDSESTTINASGAEAGTSIYKDGIDTGDTVAGDGTFSLSVDLVSETNTFDITTVDDKGNVSVLATATIEKTSASGGSFSSSTSTSASEETTEEAAPEEPVTEEEETVVEEVVPEETDDFSMAGDEEEVIPDSSPADGNDSSSQSTEETSSIAGESQTNEQDTGEVDDGVDSVETSVAGESQISGQGSDQGQTSGGGGTEVGESTPAETVVPDPAEAIIEENIPRILRFFENRRLFGERNDYGVPLTFIEELQVDFGETYDADADGITDYNELILGTDPYVPNDEIVHLSIPADLSDQDIEDAIDQFIKDSGQTIDEIKTGDTDGDGLSDMHEILMGMDPLSADGDGDGLSDGEELLFYGTDPTSETDYDVSIVIGNFIGVSEAGEGSQLITGHTYPDSVVNIFELTDKKDKLIGQSLSDEDGRYSILTDYLEPGEHIIVATSKQDGITLVSNVVILQVGEGGLTQPEHDPEVLDFGDKVYVSEAFIGLMPVLEEVLEKNAIIMLTWESTIFGQTIIADAFNLEGTIIFRPPADLDLGKHQVSWFAIDPVNGLRSTAGKIEFTVVPVTYTAVEARQNRTLWIAIALSSVLLTGLVWTRRKKRAKKKVAKTTKVSKVKVKK